MNTSPNTLKLPDPTTFTLLLIKEELKNRRFFHTLLEVGIDDCWYRADYSEVIMGAFGLDVNNDEEFMRYDEIMTEHAQRFEPKEVSVAAAAREVYEKLRDAREVSD
jgi:hypothetical protein